MIKGGLPMVTGTVKWFNSKAGYGYVKTDSGQDIYVHISSIQPYDVFRIDEGDPVRFELRYSIHGVEAKNVAKVSQKTSH